MGSGLSALKYSTFPMRKLALGVPGGCTARFLLAVSSRALGVKIASARASSPSRSASRKADTAASGVENEAAVEVPSAWFSAPVVRGEPESAVGGDGFCPQPTISSATKLSRSHAGILLIGRLPVYEWSREPGRTCERLPGQSVTGCGVCQEGPQRSRRELPGTAFRRKAAVRGSPTPPKRPTGGLHAWKQLVDRRRRAGRGSGCWHTGGNNPFTSEWQLPGSGRSGRRQILSIPKARKHGRGPIATCLLDEALEVLTKRDKETGQGNGRAREWPLPGPCQASILPGPCQASIRGERGNLGKEMVAAQHGPHQPAVPLCQS